MAKAPKRVTPRNMTALWESHLFVSQEAAVNLEGLRVFLPKRFAAPIWQVVKASGWDSPSLEYQLSGFMTPNGAIGILPHYVATFYSCELRDECNLFAVQDNIHVSKSGARIYLPEGLARRAGIKADASCLVRVGKYGGFCLKKNDVIVKGSEFFGMWIEIWDEQRRFAFEQQGCPYFPNFS